MRQRKNVVNLQAGEAAAFRHAVQSLRDLADPKSNYNHFAQIHVCCCVHGCELFLPWHRAYILDYEDALRRFSPETTLPYWDWINTPTIPDLFNEKPLSHDRHPGGGLERLPTADDLRYALELRSFSLFGGSPCLVGLPSVAGRFDSLHGQVHTWVGGDMADQSTSKSAFDPIFWSHHSNVDRIWAKWQSKFGNAGPLDTAALLPGLDTVRRTSDVLDIGIGGLAYEYVEDSFDLKSTMGAIESGSRFAADLSRLKSEFSRAEVRLHGLRQAHGSPMPSAIDVSILDRHTTARLSLFALHPIHGGAHEHGGAPRMGHPTAITGILDVTSAFPAGSHARQVTIEIGLGPPRGVPEDTCRIECERIQLVLLPA